MALAISQVPSQAPFRAPSAETSVRTGMLQALEDLVQRERFFKRRTGTFTAVLGKLEFEVPESLRGLVEVRVASADREHFLAEAYYAGGRGGEGGSRVWMDESFRIHANFPTDRLGWVVVQKPSNASGKADWEADASLPDLEVEPVGSTAAIGASWRYSNSSPD